MNERTYGKTEALDQIDNASAGYEATTIHRVNVLKPDEAHLKQEIEALQPALGAEKVCIATICDAGTSRSAWMAELLRDRGYEAHNFGAGERKANYFNDQFIKDVTDGRYQALIFADEAVEKEFREAWAKRTTDTDVLLNIPTRTLNLKEGSGVSLYRIPGHHALGYPDEAFTKTESYIKKEFDNLGFVNRKVN